MSSERFRYALDALLRRRRSDWKTAKMEETQASRVVERRDEEVGQARHGVAETEELLRETRRGGAAIDPARWHLLSGYLSLQRKSLEDRQRALTRAQEVHERIRSGLETISRGIKSLEKHRDHREADHKIEQGNREQKRVDELWLLRRRRNENRK
jgi:flagellar export protein FliJ